MELDTIHITVGDVCHEVLMKAMQHNLIIIEQIKKVENESNRLTWLLGNNTA
jgi:hypothetical protein